MALDRRHLAKLSVKVSVSTWANALYRDGDWDLAEQYGLRAFRQSASSLSDAELHLWEISRSAMPGLAHGAPIPKAERIRARQLSNSILRGLQVDLGEIADPCGCEVCTSGPAMLLRLRHRDAISFGFDHWASAVDGYEAYPTLIEQVSSLEWAGHPGASKPRPYLIAEDKAVEAIESAVTWSLALAGRGSWQRATSPNRFEISRGNGTSALRLSFAFSSSAEDQAHVSVARLRQELCIHLPSSRDGVSAVSLAHELAHACVEILVWMTNEGEALLSPWVGRWREAPAIYIERLLCQEIGLRVPPEEFSRDAEWVANGLFGIGLHSLRHLDQICVGAASAEVSHGIEAALGRPQFEREPDPVLGSLALLRRNSNWQAHAIGVLNDRADDADTARKFILAGPTAARSLVGATVPEFGG